MPQYSEKALYAMAEARCISSSSDMEGYTSMEKLKASLDDLCIRLGFPQLKIML